VDSEDESRKMNETRPTGHIETTGTNGPHAHTALSAIHNTSAPPVVLHIKGLIPRHKEKIMEIDFRPKPYKGELVFSDIEDGQFFVDCDGDLFQKTNESFANMIAAQDGSPEAVGNIHFSPNADVKRIAAVTKINF